MIMLATPRLRCEMLHQADWPFFLSLYQNQAVMRQVMDAMSETEIRDAFESRLAPWSPGAEHWLCLLVREASSGEPLGLTGFIQREKEMAEVGFLFSPTAQGKGYGTESLRAVCDFAFSEGKFRRLTATVTAGNLASRRVLEKVGFVLEGELRESYWLGGKWHNDWLMGLLRSDYFPSP
ncbi:GNAT family N-acetyltransferase [Enterobacter sp. CC120223-11]|uniref:GNAT family N-acetyltransferase n=1 Tax=Enterobacter sp. CC120223-11 TaxID=1378073 RepID=UPI000BCF5643|nr:GNAT family protein [Enterobacter sp. CC120223-11]SNY71371.1 Protein N-acetyltransferase, RimJ/RimL family [Enterobacter sp. CC120223-11]